MSDQFWEFDAWVKWDELDEITHERLIFAALRDRHTGIQRHERNSVIVYGPEEALLFRPRTALFRVVMFLYEGLYAVLAGEK